jgi:muramidase (phage lysozyme)
MADSDVIKEFLVKLGFEVDTNGLRRWTQGLHEGERVAVEFAGAIAGLVGAVVLAVTKLSEQGEKLYYISQRTHAAAQNIQAFGFAVSQMGGTVDSANESLENLANFLRSSPGAGNLLKSLGINPTEDPTKIMADLGAKFRKMPIYRAQMFAQMFGIDQKTMFALIAGVDQFQQVYASMLQKAGVNASAAAAASHGFMVEVRTLGAAFDILAQKVNLSLAGAMTNDVKAFRILLVNNFSVISAFIVKVTKGILAAATATITLITSAVQGFQALSVWFNSLPVSTQRIIEGFGLLILAWRALNSAFLLSPLGMIAGLGLAILLLWQDYQTWKAGGKSLIDWKAWQPDLQKAHDWIIWFAQKVNDLAHAVGGWQHVFEAFAAYLATKWIASLTATLIKAGVRMLTFGAVSEGVLGAGAGGITGMLLVAGAALAALIANSNAAAVKTIPGLTAAEQADQLLAQGSGEPNLFPQGPNPDEEKNQWGTLGPPSKWWSRAQNWLFGKSKTIAPVASKGLTPQQAGFLETLGSGEGGNDYGSLYGGGHVDDLSRFPNWSGLPAGNGSFSHAAGRYQFEPATWARAAAALGLKDFSPESQDKAALWLAGQDYAHNSGGRDLNKDLQSNDPMVISKVFSTLHSTWPSLFGTQAQVNTFARRVKADGAAGAAPVPTAPVTAPPSAPAVPANAAQEREWIRQHSIMAPNTPTAYVTHNHGGIIQHNNVVVHEARDAQGSARLVHAAQRKFNSGLIRNLPTRMI